MKFTPVKYESYAKHEFEMYTSLYAINNSNIEGFGIPSVHYFGRLCDHILMALTFLDIDCEGIFANHNYIEADVLIIFREFVGYLLCTIIILLTS